MPSLFLDLQGTVTVHDEVVVHDGVVPRSQAVRHDEVVLHDTLVICFITLYYTSYITLVLLFHTLLLQHRFHSFCDRSRVLEGDRRCPHDFLLLTVSPFLCLCFRVSRVFIVCSCLFSWINHLIPRSPILSWASFIFCSKNVMTWPNSQSTSPPSSVVRHRRSRSSNSHPWRPLPTPTAYLSIVNPSSGEVSHVLVVPILPLFLFLCPSFSLHSFHRVYCASFHHVIILKCSTICAKIITVLTRYRPIVLELI